MNEVRQEFNLISADESKQNLVLSIDYDTFLALGFDGYDGEDLRAFIRNAIQRGQISVRCSSLVAEINRELDALGAMK